MDKEEKRIINYLKRRANEPLEVNENYVDTCILVDIKDCRQLVNFIEKQQKEIKELRQRINRLIVMKYVENDYYTEVRKENSISKYKIRKLIEEKAKTDTYNFKTIAVKDIEELLGE